MNNDDTFKANHTPDNTPPRTEIEARIVAWVLGEASPFEVAELERLCAAQPELAVFKNRISAVHGLVTKSAKPVDSTLRLSPDRRAKLLAILKVEGDLRAPSNPSPKPVPKPVPQSVPQSVPESVPQSASSPVSPSGPASVLQSIPQLTGQPVAPRTPVPARKSNVVAFLSTMRQWALPIAACFALLLLVSATLAPTVYRASRAQFALGPTAEFSFTAGDKQAQVLESSPMLQNPFTSVTSAPFKDAAAPAPHNSVDSRFPAEGLKVVGNNGSFANFEQVAPQAGSVGGRGQPAVADLESELLSNNLSASSQVASYGGQPTGLGAGSGRVGGVGFGTGSISTSSASTNAFPTSAANGGAAVDPFVVPSTSRSLEVASSAFRQRKTNVAGSGNSTGGYVSEQVELGKLVAKGRSQYLAGASDDAQETFRQIEAVNPTNPEAKSFLSRIANEKARQGEANRTVTRSKMIGEVSNAWQRPSVSTGASISAAATPSAEWKPAILGKDRDQEGGAAGVVITAGTPQTFTGVNFTDADRAEIDRRYAKKKELRASLGDAAKNNVDGELQKRADALVVGGVAQSAGIDWDYIEASREVVSEIKIAETKAAKAEKTAAEKTDAPATPTAPSDPKILESARTELAAKDEAMSTFSLHVSNASYRLAKDALAKGLLPNPDTIRPEEFCNAFDYGDPAPVAGEPVAARIEQAVHPFMQQRNLVRIAMRVPAAGRGASQPLRLTVMLDTSGSMEREDRAATVRAALASLTSLLGPNDRVTLIGFARTPRLIAESVTGDNASTLLEAAAQTPSEGGTNLEAALRLAETQALRQYTDGAQNRIVLLTDGATNLGDADPASLATRIEKLRQRGVAFDACGIVAEGLNDNVLESLTRKGDGRYSIINSPEDADANFARQLAGAFRPAAKDVKVQVHFNPARVGRYRLIGFEQHRLKTEDFRNDAVDAAELASEEAATALYQVEVLPQGEGELGEVSVRFLDTNTNQRVERSWTIAYDAKPPAFAKASASIQLAGSAAFLAEKLRGGELAAQFRLEDLATVVNGLATAYPNSVPVREFIITFQQARRVTGD